jgi:hypothetical protein
MLPAPHLADDRGVVAAQGAGAADIVGTFEEQL